jgi:hypothetical protein
MDRRTAGMTAVPIPFPRILTDWKNPLVHWTGEDWAKIPPQPIALADLTWILDSVYVHGLINAANGGPSFLGDPYPQVVAYNDQRYLWDGHHRATLALLRGQTHILARVAWAYADRRAPDIQKYADAHS